MRMTFEPEEADEYAAASDLLIRRGLGWAEDCGLPADGLIWAAALELRHDSVDGRLGYWTAREVARFLLDFVPGEVVATHDELAAVPRQFLTFLRFLDLTDLLDPRGDDIDVLTAAVHRTDKSYPAAIEDPSRWSVAKFWAMTALDQGVDPADLDAMGVFIDRVQADRVAYDEELLAEIMEREDASPGMSADRALPQPPVDLPGTEELAAAAAANPLVGSLTSLTAWIGAGRDLDDDGTLPLDAAREAARLLDTGEADAGGHDDMPRLGLLLAWARETRIVRRHRGRLVPVKKNAKLLRDPLALWDRAVTVLPELGRAVCVSPWNGEGFNAFAASFDDYVPDLLNTVYGLTAPIPVPRIREPLLYDLADRWLTDPEGGDPDDESLRGDLDDGLATTLDVLDAYGITTSERGVPDAIFRSDLDDEDQEDLPPAALERLRRDLDRPQRLVRLTDLGTWAVRRRLLAEGRSAPLTGELADASAAQLLMVLAGDGYPPAATFAEVDLWLTGEGRGSADLLAAAATTPFHSNRAPMLAVLVGSLPEGMDLMHRLRGDPILGPSAVQVLTQRDALPLEEVTPEESERVVVESLASLLEEGGPTAVHQALAALPAAERAGVVELVRTSADLDDVVRAEFQAALNGREE